MSCELELTNSCRDRKFLATAVAMDLRASATLSSELDHNVNTGPHSFNSARYSVGGNREY